MVRRGLAPPERVLCRALGSLAQFSVAGADCLWHNPVQTYPTNLAPISRGAGRARPSVNEANVRVDHISRGDSVHHPIKQGWKLRLTVRGRLLSTPYLRYAVLRGAWQMSPCHFSQGALSSPCSGVA